MFCLVLLQLLILSKTVVAKKTQMTISSMFNSPEMIEAMQQIAKNCKNDKESAQCAQYQGYDNFIFTDGTDISKDLEKVPQDNDILEIMAMQYSGEIDFNHLKSKNIVILAGIVGSDGIQIVGGIKDKVSILQLGVEVEIVKSDLDVETVYLLNLKTGEYNVKSDYLISAPQYIDNLPMSQIKTRHILINLESTTLSYSLIRIILATNSWLICYDDENGMEKDLVEFSYEYADIFGFIYYGNEIEISINDYCSVFKPLNITIKESIIPSTISSVSLLDIEKVVKVKPKADINNPKRPKLYFSYNDEIVEIDKSELEGFETEDKILKPVKNGGGSDNNNKNNNNNKKKLSTPAIIGIIVGCVVFVAIVVVVIVVVVKKKQGVGNSSN